jgi:hypothetical protein
MNFKMLSRMFELWKIPTILIQSSMELCIYMAPKMNLLSCDFDDDFYFDIELYYN